MPARRRGYKSRSTTIFLDFEKAFEVVSKEVLVESVVLRGIRGQMLMWLDDYLTNRTGTIHFQGKKSKVNHLMMRHELQMYPWYTEQS